MEPSQYIKTDGSIPTLATWDMMVLPPQPPITSLTSSFSSKTMIGDMDDIGRLPGAMKFAALGLMDQILDLSPIEKSSISLL
jgi:hypothetical protein